MAVKVRKGIVLVLVAAMLTAALPALAWGQSEYDLNGYTIGGGAPSAGQTGMDSATLSGSNIFAGAQPTQQNDLQVSFAAPQSVPHDDLTQSYSTSQAVPNLAVQQNSAGSMLRSEVPSRAGAHVIRWSGADITVQVGGNPAANGETPVNFDSVILVAVSPDVKNMVSSCTAEYTIKYKKPYESETTVNERIALSLESGSDYLWINNGETVDYGELLTDVVITVELFRSYPIWVEGEQVSDLNRDNIGEKSFSVSYNPDRNTLFLNNAVINGTITVKTTSPFTIAFSGNNTVYGVSGTDFGISCDTGLTISSYSSADTLTVAAPPSNNSCAIAVKGNMRIGSSANVTAYSQGGTTTSTGVYVTGLLEVDGMLSAAGGSAAESCGIRCNMLAVKNINSAAGGAVVAYGGDCYSGGSSAGVLAEGNVAVEYQSKLAAAGKGAAGSSCGVRTGGSFTNNGSADCSSGSAGNDSTGIFSDGTVTNSGTLSAKGGTSSGGASRGLSAGSLMMTGGALDAHAVTGASGSVGIFALTTISGGEVIAEGAGGAFSSMPAFSGYTPMIRVSDLTSDAFEVPFRHYNKCG